MRKRRQRKRQKTGTEDIDKKREEEIGKGMLVIFTVRKRVINSEGLRNGRDKIQGIILILSQLSGIEEICQNK